MFLQNPLVWWLAPLALLPFLIHFRQFIRQHTQALPSLFFVRKLLAQKHQQFKRRYLTETILETLLILGALLLWSQPTAATAPQAGEKLVVLIDDSPSMRYYYQEQAGATGSQLPSRLLPTLTTLLQQNTFSEITLRRLSATAANESTPLSSVTQLQTFLKNIGASAGNTAWQASALSSLLSELAATSTATNVRYLLYSDFKANHFKTNPTNIAKQTAFKLPSGSLYIQAEPSAPSLMPLKLPTRHFFKREKLIFSQDIANVPTDQTTAAADLFLEVSLNAQKVFLSKLSVPTQTPAAAVTTLKLPIELVLDTAGTHLLSTTLLSGTVPVQRESEVLFVYPKLSLRPLTRSPAVINFLEALFLHDNRAETITLSANGQTLLITDPAAALAQLKLQTLQTQPAIVLLSPQQDVRRMESYLQMFSGTPHYLSSVEKMSAQSQFYWNERPQATPNFDDSFSADHSYLKLSPQSIEHIRPLFSIDQTPVSFQLGQKVFFTFLSETSLLTTPHPLQLVWFYEALFALNGGKRVVPIYDEAAFTLATLNANTTKFRPLLVSTNSSAAANAESTITPSGIPPPRAWEDAQHVYLLSSAAEEYTSTSLIPNNTTPFTLPHLGAATLLTTASTAAHSAQSKIFNFTLSDFILFMEILCLLLLFSVFYFRMQNERLTA